jgi:hypothetical protein
MAEEPQVVRRLEVVARRRAAVRRARLREKGVVRVAELRPRRGHAGREKERAG